MAPRRFGDDDVRLMRRRAAAGESLTALARDFGISQPNVSQIVGGHTYRSAGGPLLPYDPARGRWRPGRSGNPNVQHVAWSAADRLLGTMSDRQVATAIGCSSRAVIRRRRRRALGVRPWRDLAYGERLEADDMVGAERYDAIRGGLSVTYLAKRDGVTIAAICASIREYWSRRVEELVARQGAIMTTGRRTSGRGTLDVSRPAPLKRSGAPARGSRSSSSPAGTLRPAPPLYTHPTRPGQLLARERRWWVIWPAVRGGWALRRPYEALDVDVPPGAVPTPLTAAWGTGWRHAVRPDHVPAKGPVPTVGGAEDRRPITVHVPSAVLEAIDRARGPSSRSAWARAALERALQAPLP